MYNFTNQDPLVLKIRPGEIRILKQEYDDFYQENSYILREGLTTLYLSKESFPELETTKSTSEIELILRGWDKELNLVNLYENKKHWLYDNESDILEALREVQLKIGRNVHFQSGI